MAYSYITKQALAHSLKVLLEQSPFSKISVSDICKQCGMNRKSFYYHFQDKYDLVNWIFDNGIKEFTGREDLWEKEISWEQVKTLCQYIYDNRSFYSKLVLIDGQNSFLEHLREVLEPGVRKFLGQMVPEEQNLDFYINYFTDSFLAALIRWVLENDTMEPEQFVTYLRTSMTLLSSVVEKSLDKK